VRQRSEFAIDRAGHGAFAEAMFFVPLYVKSSDLGQRSICKKR
jgi:hypothetical protein